ncbi:MAG: N-acetylmuramoyl-L-alanine amidase [Pedobacter sp.]|nr:N-acetylmuramoyl-L-alanine amidase [Chitinophagaceae bacterium]
MKYLFFFGLMVSGFTATSQDTTKHFWLGRTSGKLPNLSYGLGEDRLGGAKLGYIDTNVVLKIIDSTKELFLVQLSKNHSAYIAKEFVKPDSITKLKAFYLTDSWYVKGTDTCYDIASINIGEHLPYKSWMEIGPSKIMVDIYGVQSNTNWITQLQNLKEIKNIYYNQVEDDVVRITIELVHQQHWGYSIAYNKKALVIKVKRQPDLAKIKQLKIAIDAGHGGTNGGTEGVTSHAIEKEFTLLFAKAFEKYLRTLGFKNIVQTRTFDTTLNNSDRVVFLQQQNPDLLLSFHLNSSSKAEVNGTSTYYKHIGFRPLTTAILKRMLAIKMNEYGNIGSFNFTLNAPTDFPNCLVEVGFLSNREDEKKIITKAFHALVAKQVYLGMNDWLQQCKKQ